MEIDKTATLRSSQAVVIDGADDVRRAAVADFFELTKPRLSLMSVISAMAGYLLAVPPRDVVGFFGLLAGTALAAGGAAALNQWMEREADLRMRRTRERPLPAGRVSPGAALAFGIALCIAGPALVLLTNWIAAALTAATVLVYLLAYTPLKQLSPRATEVGALPGALPPLIGWTAATGTFGPMGWFLFGILFAWQLPHFMAISWMFRDDYARGGFRMLSVSDTTGRSVAWHAMGWTCVLLGVAALPVLWAQAGWLYIVGAPLLCGWMIAEAFQFLRATSKDLPARRLFFTSITWLPAFLVILLVDRYLF